MLIRLIFIDLVTMLVASSLYIIIIHFDISYTHTCRSKCMALYQVCNPTLNKESNNNYVPKMHTEIIVSGP